MSFENTHTHTKNTFRKYLYFHIIVSIELNVLAIAEVNVVKICNQHNLTESVNQRSSMEAHGNFGETKMQ